MCEQVKKDMQAVCYSGIFGYREMVEIVTIFCALRDARNVSVVIMPCQEDRFSTSFYCAAEHQSALDRIFSEGEMFICGWHEHFTRCVVNDKYIRTEE